jgi:hypothetical protein
MQVKGWNRHKRLYLQPPRRIKVSFGTDRRYYTAVKFLQVVIGSALYQ